MQWARAHPYASTIMVACIFVIAGALLVMRGTTPPASSGISTWNGNPSAINAPALQTTDANEIQATVAPVATQNYGTTTLPYPSSQASSAPTSTSNIPSGPFNYDTLMAEIAASSHSSASKPATSGSNSAGTVDSGVWNFIPSGMIATTTPSNGRTATQQALYLYGNEIGSYVEGYDAANSNQDTILSDANNDRQNATKAAAVERIGMSLETVGSGMAETTGVPASATSDNAALAESYTAIGKALITVGQSEALADSTLVSAIEAYDAAVDTFNKNYIALATLFSVSGVTFSSGDPGSVFSFSSSSL
jgi:hypothetical protein